VVKAKIVSGPTLGPSVKFPDPGSEIQTFPSDTGYYVREDGRDINTFFPLVDVELDNE
jgi:hypothetical protein